MCARASVTHSLHPACAYGVASGKAAHWRAPHGCGASGLPDGSTPGDGGPGQFCLSEVPVPGLADAPDPARWSRPDPGSGAARTGSGEVPSPGRRLARRIHLQPRSHHRRGESSGPSGSDGRARSPVGPCRLSAALVSAVWLFRCRLWLLRLLWCRLSAIVTVRTCRLVGC